MLPRFRSIVRALVSRRDFESGMTEELRFHVEQYTDELVRSGVPIEHARRRARLEFGAIEAVQQECREARGLGFVDEIVRECRYTFRQLRGTPGFTATVVATLALAIGANTAIFSIVNALLLEHLPYPQPERLATIYARTTGVSGSDSRRTIDGEQWELMRDRVQALTPAVSGIGVAGVNLEARGRARYVQGGRVSARYFEVLGLRPLVGRGFSEEEDRPRGPKAVVISNALWRSEFDGDQGVIGRAVLLRGEPHTIVGVLPEGDATPLDADLYTPLQASRNGEGRAANFLAIARLRDDASWQEADAQINLAWAESRRVRTFAQNSPGRKVVYFLMPLQRGTTDPLRPQVLALMGAAGLILLIACGNIAGLTLVRMAQRTSELVTRVALGASSWQIQKQLWIESAVLALSGGAAGVGTGFVLLRALLAALPDRFLPVASVQLDARVLGFTLALSLLTTIFFGMLPAASAQRADLRSAIPGRTVVSAGGLRFRQALIAGEVALTIVLLAAAGLLVRTLIHLETLPAGFEPHGVITAKASLDVARYREPAAFRKLLAGSLDLMRRIPGVENAAVAATVPYERPLIDSVTIGDGSTRGRELNTYATYVTPGFFETLRIPLLSGRTFTEADGPESERVVVVNLAFARRFFPGASPIGRHLDKIGTIVGVVADTVHSTMARLSAETSPLASEEILYLPAPQITDVQYLTLVHTWFRPSWIVRAGPGATDVPARMQHALASVDPRIPFAGFYSMSDVMATMLAMQRIQVGLLAALAGLALLLSALGIFALVANVVAQRTREIGIRLALGATIQKAMIQTGRAGAAASAAGLAIGLIACAGVLRVMRSVVFGVGVYDATTILAATLTLCLVALVATVLPMLRVANIDPSRTLREY